ncbi:MAG: hypothetical protein IJF03_08610 [Lachnospiraceae bacterium]|nr:hypothetical protein [Lachnospiraceae bacterium]
MSNYQFFASNKELREYKNSKWDFLKFFVRYIIRKKDYEEEESSIRICKENDLSTASFYTEKSYCAYVEWGFSEKNADIIMEYIKSHLKESKEIELWNVWEGERAEADVTECFDNQLTIQHIKEIWGKDHFEKPEGLRIKNANISEVK